MAAFITPPAKRRLLSPSESPHETQLDLLTALLRVVKPEHAADVLGEADSDAYTEACTDPYMEADEHEGEEPAAAAGAPAGLAPAAEVPAAEPDSAQKFWLELGLAESELGESDAEPWTPPGPLTPPGPVPPPTEPAKKPHETQQPEASKRSEATSRGSAPHAAAAPPFGAAALPPEPDLQRHAAKSAADYSWRTQGGVEPILQVRAAVVSVADAASPA